MAKSKEHKPKKKPAKQKQMSSVHVEETIELKPNDFEMPGVTILALSELTQKAIGCIVGETITTEQPWVYIKKETLEDNLDLHEESSEFLPIKQEIQKYPEDELLMGIDVSLHDQQEEFFICLTKEAKQTVLLKIEQHQEEMQDRLKNSIIKEPRPWECLGSDVDVDDELIKNLRNLLEIEVRTRYPVYANKVKFSERPVEAAVDGYVELLPTRFTANNIYKRRVDSSVQASPETTPKLAQTNPLYPKNKFTQYNYEYEEPKMKVSDYKQLNSFFQTRIDHLCDAIRVNGYINLHEDDYMQLMQREQSPPMLDHREIFILQDVISCKGMKVSSVCWHPLISGLLAAAYIKTPYSYICTEELPSISPNDTIHSKHLVLIWSYSDNLIPKLYLYADREVYIVSFCPTNPNILAGALSNGQIILWDITGCIERVEARKIRTQKEIRHSMIIHSMMHWMKFLNSEAVVLPTVISDIDYGHTSPVTNLVWLSSTHEITANGKVTTDLKAPSLQFITCGTDGLVFIWDLNRVPGKEASKRLASILCLPVVTQLISCLPTVVAAMEMVATTPNGTGTVPAPFQRRDVEEWSGLNRLTGMLEHARVETDHWATKTQNSVHNYGKVIDSRNQCTPDGNNLQKARRQLEVFQSKVPGGSVQVIRTQTSSSSKWSTGTPNGAPGFQDLKLALNPLDTSSQKTKANVGRSGSIGGRRPPTRPRSSITVDDDDVTARLERVSRLCQQLHNETLINSQSDTENNSMPYDHKTSTTPLDNQKPNQTLSGTSNYNPTHTPQLIKPQSNNTTRTLESNYVRSHLPEHSTTNTTSFLSRTTLDESTDSRNYLNSDKKSNLLTRTLDINNFDSSSNSDTWRSKSYSSHRKPHLDAGGRLNSVLRNTNLDLEALDHILKSISSSSSSNSEESNEKDLTTKRQSFVTVESLKEVKGRLRRLSSPGEDLNLVDDGIAMPNPKVTKVRSYVYGMEALLHKAPLLGTGSLESRVSSKGNGSCNRSEDWFNRRKSYGFEKVNNQQINVCLRSKNKIESSTDSGICRSTEIVVPQVQKLLFVPKSTIINLSSDTKTNNNAEHELFNVWNRRAINEKVTTSTPTTPDTKRHSIAVDDSKYVQHPEVPKYRRTSLAIGDTYDLDDLSSNSERKPKRVEFCKTEVHFAAESGRVNIVETDEKPPPTQNFRRRRRTNSNVTNNHVPEVLIKTGLPLIHFGDTTYEKKLFGVVDEPVLQEAFNTDLKTSGNGHEVTVSVLKDYEIEATNTLESENPPRSILKNKISKPKPYILGDAFMGATNETDEDNIWGVRLRPVYKQEVALPRIWRSTVTVQNTAYASQEPEVDIEVAKPEFQKLLFALRPSRRSESSIPKCEVKEEVEVDLRRSSWSVADRVKQVEDVKEVKGFSTKVNFGSGEATVVENETNVATWPRSDDVSNKGFQSSKQQPQVSKHLGGFRYENKSNAEAKVSIRTFESKPLEELPKKSFSYPRKDIETNRTQLGVSFPKRLTNEHATYKREVLIDKNKLLKNLDSSISGKNIRKTYGANQSPKPIKSTRIWNKPDLLQHYNNREYVNLSAVIQNPQKPTSNQLKTITKRPDSPTVQRSESPIYENIDEVISGLHSGLKQESEILEELTRAADQILQAVNGYTDEESLKFSSGEDEDKKHRLNLKMSNDLSTITETKSLGAVVMKQSRVSLTKTRVKTSSNSSIESLSREAKPVPPVRMNRAAKLSEDKNRKKITGSSSEVTRARRLQRASSREALLQSHGSSSEDITSSVEVRKPRLTRRLKTASEEVVEGNRRLSASQGGKKIGLDAKKSVDRASGLQEIRHKTAVSTIKSTAEKAAIRSSKTQSVEVQKRFTTCSNVSSLMSRGGVSAMTSPQGRVDANGISALRIGKGLYVMRCNSILALDTRNAECPCMCS